MIYLHVLQLIGTNKLQLDQFFDDTLGYTNVDEPFSRSYIEGYICISPMVLMLEI